jgi:hypothetical protein
LSVSFSVYAVTPTTAYVGGVQDIARTNNAGATWTIERPNDTAWFCLNFLDTENGWAGGQDQEIDDVPGSIWKRSGANSVSRAETPVVVNSDLPVDVRMWKTPPSSPENDFTK